jgi:integrase
MSHRKSMQGITRRGPSYRFTVYLGRRLDGGQLRRYKTWRPPYGTSRWEADRLAVEAYQRFRSLCRTDAEAAQSMRFSDLYTLYFAEYAPARLKPSTVYNYRCMADSCILPVFGLRPLAQITTAELSAFLMGHPGKSGATCVKLKVILSSMFSFAVTQGYLSANPCRNALCRPLDSAPAVVLTQEEASLLNQVLRSWFCPEHVILHTLLHTGLRTGECLGLRWEDVDFEHQILHIRRSLAWAGHGIYLSTPKTRSSQRSIRFDRSVFELLAQQRAYQKLQMQRSETWQQPGMVFTNEHGGYYCSCHLRRFFYRTLQTHRLPSCTLHSLRHTFATLMINAGVHIKAISAVLGHSSITVTGDIYSHSLAEYEARAAAAVSLRLEEASETAL